MVVVGRLAAMKREGGAGAHFSVRDYGYGGVVDPVWDTSNFPLNLVRSLPTDDEADSSSRGSTALLPPLLYRKDIAELSVLVGAVFGLHSSASDESAESAEGGGDHGGGSGGIGSSGGGGGGGGQEEAPVFHRSPSITGLATLDGLEPTAALVGTLKIELGGWHPRSELLPTNRMNRMCECTASEFRELALDCLMALVSAEAAASGGDLDSSGHIDGIEAMVGYSFFPLLVLHTMVWDTHRPTPWDRYLGGGHAGDVAGGPIRPACDPLRATHPSRSSVRDGDDVVRGRLARSLSLLV